MVDNIYVIEGNPVSWKEAIQMTADELYKNGCVEADFYQNCIKMGANVSYRISNTGAVAIPHAESCCSIHKNGIWFIKIGNTGILSSNG